MRRRRTYRSDVADKVSGLLAYFDSTCPVCDGPILTGQSRVVKRRGSYVHVQCVAGGDE